MHIEKINDHQFRCILNTNDLNEHKLTIRELRYGNPATMELFKDVVREVSSQYGFKADGPLMIEAVPISPDELMVTVSAVEESDELDPHFACFAPSADVSAHSQAPEPAKPAVPFLSTEEDAASEDVCVAILDTIDDVTRLCSHLFLPFRGSSLLYRPDGSHFFYLVLLRGAMPGSDFNSLINSIREYASPVENSRLVYAGLKEYGRPVMEDPVLRLGLMD